MIDSQRITVLHETAMELLDRGLLERDSSRAQDWFRSAFEKERAAASLLVDARDEEPTRSVLYRSAATLALDCREYDEAERLIAEGLSGTPPFEIASELKDLKRRVLVERAKSQGSPLDEGARSIPPSRPGKLRTA
jgi:hypothetical protein